MSSGCEVSMPDLITVQSGADAAPLIAALRRGNAPGSDRIQADRVLADRVSPTAFISLTRWGIS